MRHYFDAGAVSASVAYKLDKFDAFVPVKHIRDVIDTFCQSLTNGETYRILCDSKPYFSAQHDAGYKLGRKPWANKTKVDKILNKLPQSDRVSGLEADQLAGLICILCPEPITLYTLDTDWYQLISDNVSVFDLYYKRMRNISEEEAVAYYNSKYGKKLVKGGHGLIRSVSEIVLIKSLYGDKADKLCPQSDPRMYNLRYTLETTPL